MYVSMYLSLSLSIYIYIYIYMYTHMYIYIYTYVLYDVISYSTTLQYLIVYHNIPCYAIP